MSVYAASDALLNTPSVAASGMPEPFAPTVSMKTSPPATEFCTAGAPAIGSVRAAAVTRTAGEESVTASVPLFGDGVTDTPEVAGAVVSTTRPTVTAALQLPAASRLRIETTRLPSGRPLTTAAGMV